MGREGRGEVIVLTVVRVAWGAVLLAAPRMVMALIGQRPAGVRSRLVARLLGARDLVQAVVLARHQSRPTVAGIAVDALHSSTMLGLAIRRPEYRRGALFSALIAACFAISGAQRARADA